MISRLLPTGLRAQLALAIAVVTAFGVGASFLALYSGVGTRLVSQIDGDLQHADVRLQPVPHPRRRGEPALPCSAPPARIWPCSATTPNR